MSGRNFCRLLLFCLVGLAAGSIDLFGAGVNVTNLHNFIGYTGDDYGALPQARLIESNGVFYGTTSAGGPPQNGVVFRMNKDASGFAVLHAFAGTNGQTDGSFPTAPLVLQGNTLYGTTLNGGLYGYGTVFSVQTNGTAYAKLYDFTGLNDGANPSAGLVANGNILYGCTGAGGANESGTIFALSTDGSSFTNIYSFSALDPATQSNPDGANPQGTLVLSGNTLFGAASAGGQAGVGTVFQVNTDGSGFATLYAFGFFDGADPEGALALSGTVLYGTTFAGGSDFAGNVFSVDTNTLAFASLYSFTGGSDGANPISGVAVGNGMLYGTTVDGGANGTGAVYALSTDGSVFDPLYSFSTLSLDTGTNTDGALPEGAPLLSGTNLYGTTTGGGPVALGTIFRIDTNGDFTTLWTFAAPATNSEGSEPGGNLALSGNTLYSTTQFGGAADDGTIFKVNTDGSGFATLYSFSLTDAVTYTNNDGSLPVAGLALGGSELYGTAAAGGSNASGTLFSIDTGGSHFNALYSFSATDENGLNSDGQAPDGGVTLGNNVLYGVTSLGGSGGSGTIFSINTDGSGFQTLYSFSAVDTNGSTPVNGDGAGADSRLLLSGSTLYGAAYSGGSYGGGTIFSIATNGANFTVLYTFTANADGYFPQGGLVMSGNTLYGTASGGGAYNNGVIYKINTDGSGFATLYSFSAEDANTFSNADGGMPLCDLLLSGNVLYGTAFNGGQNGEGTVFQLNTDGSGFLTLLNFDAETTGANPEAGLLETGGYLYGTASAGGAFTDGSVFAVNLRDVPTQLNIQPAGANIVLTWSDAYYNLQVSTNVQSGYATLASAASPFTTNTAAGQQFFRLRSAP